jgi:hypothetical protein
MSARIVESPKIKSCQKVDVMNAKSCGCEHDFTLVLADPIELTEDIEDRLFEAGCGDATISIRAGRMFITFSRDSESLKSAILSAIAAVRKASTGTDVLRVDYCNLVTQADIARKIGRTRQLVHQYMVGHRGPGGFPPPACEITDGQFLWFWCEVAYWLWENSMLKEDVLRDAQEVEVINNVLELQRQRRQTPALTKEVIDSVG